MGQVKTPGPVKLICGVLAGGPDWLGRAGRSLAANIGPVESVSDVWPFDCTDYYAEQMGKPLFRQFVAFDGTVDAGELARIKLRTNELEAELAAAERFVVRPVNLDPGYIALDKLVLATTKDYSHRIYLGRGIYAEVTLHYHKGAWRAWPWTYPDYARPTYHQFFLEVRRRLRDRAAQASTQR